MTNKILIQSNSVSLPTNLCNYEKTWPHHLREKFEDNHIIIKADSGKTTEDLNKTTETTTKRQLELYNPDVIIIQLGISDCAPRILRNYERKIVQHQPFHIVDQVSKFLVNKLRTRSGKRARVSETQYYSNIENYVERAEMNGVDLILFVKTLQAGEKYKWNNHPRAEKQIQDYNNILEVIAKEHNICQTISPLADNPSDEKDIVDDHTDESGSHFNGDGHKLVSERINKILLNE